MLIVAEDVAMTTVVLSAYFQFLNTSIHIWFLSEMFTQSVVSVTTTYKTYNYLYYLSM